MIVLGSDDYCDHNPFPLSMLDRMKDKFPKFKITLFSIPERTSTYIHRDYIQYGVHGRHHTRLECKDWDDNSLGYLKDWPYAKVFKPPHWAISDEAATFLLDNDWILCLHPTDQRFKAYRNTYRSEINPDALKIGTNKAQLITTHISPLGQNTCGNDLALSEKYFMELPEDTEFFFIKEWVDGCV